MGMWNAIAVTTAAKSVAAGKSFCLFHLLMRHQRCTRRERPHVMFVHLFNRNALAQGRVLSRAGQEMDPGAPAANTAPSQEGIQTCSRPERLSRSLDWAGEGVEKLVAPAARGDLMFAPTNCNVWVQLHKCPCISANSARVLCWAKSGPS